MTDKDKLLQIAKEQIYYELRILYNVTNDVQARDLIFRIEDIRADISHLPDYLPSYAYWSINSRRAKDIENIEKSIENIKKRHEEKNIEHIEKVNKELLDAARKIKQACDGHYKCDGCPFVTKNEDCVLIMDGNLVPESWEV